MTQPITTPPPAALPPLVQQAKDDADRALAAVEPTLTPADITTATGTIRDLLAAGWKADAVTRYGTGSHYTLIHPSGRELAIQTTPAGVRLLATGLTVDQTAGAVVGAGLTAEPETPSYVAPIRAAVDRHRWAQEAYALARVRGDRDTEAAYQAELAAHVALTRLVLAAIDAQAVTR